MLKNKRPVLNKITAAFTAASMLASMAVFPVDSAAQKLDNAGIFIIPASYGKVTSAGYFGKGDIIINIQDLHCHGEVQRNIAGILGYIDSLRGLDGVYLEGASGGADTGLISVLRKSELGAAAVEKLVDGGYLDGTEYYAAVSGKTGFIKGLEDGKIYKRNIELLNEIINLGAEIESVTARLMYEIKPVRRAYANGDVKKLSRLVKKFEKKTIGAGEFYSRLAKMGKEAGIDVESKYKNINAYASLPQSAKINVSGAARQFLVFISKAKDLIAYAKYSELAERSGGFSRLEDISGELAEIDRRYNITGSNGLHYLSGFFKYLEFNRQVNPMEFAKEEKALKDELFSACARSVYEREVLFLNGFIPTIKGYFSANITAEELETFNADFKKFRKLWCSYFPENTAKKLDKYARMLNEYHENNLKRDRIFYGAVGGSPASGKEAYTGKEALRKIESEIGNADMKVIITGGFHSKGLEKLFAEEKINYIIVTPNITADAKEAYDIYINTVKGYRNIIKNTINTKPFMSEALNESMPKLVAAAYGCIKSDSSLFYGLSEKEKISGLVDFIEKFAAEHKKTAVGEVDLGRLSIDKFSGREMSFSAEYKNKKTGETSAVKTYRVRDGKIIDADIDDEARRKTGIAARKSEPFSVLNAIFKDASSRGYKIFTAFVAPVAEEILFRYLPFELIAAYAEGTPSFVFFAAAALFVTGAAFFTVLHGRIDKISTKAGRHIVKRDMKRIFVSSGFLTAAYLLISFAFPGMPFLALGSTVLMHAANNILSLKNKTDNPVLSLFYSGSTAKRKKAEEFFDEKADAFIEEVKSMQDLQISHYGGAPWSLRGEMKNEFGALVEKFERVLKMRTDEKYEKAAQTLNEFYNFSSRLADDVKAFENFYKFKIDLLKAMLPLSALVYRSGTSEPLARTVFKDAVECFSGIYLSFSVLVFPVAEIYEFDKDLSFEFAGMLYEEKPFGSYSSRKLSRPSVRSFEEAREQMPYPLKIMVRDEDIEEYYANIGIDIFKKSVSLPYLPSLYRILAKLPPSFRRGENYAGKEVIFKMTKRNPKAADRSLGEKFDYYRQLLENNALALSELNGSGDSAVEDSIVFVEKMTENFKKIDSAFGSAAEKSLNRIKKTIAGGITPEMSARHKTLGGGWSIYEMKSIEDINRLHTLINAIHQTAVARFMKLRNVTDDKDDAQIYLEDPEKKLSVTVSDFSQKEPSREVLDFLAKIAQLGDKYDRFSFLGKDGVLIWSKKIGAHSVDVMFDFNNLEDGVRVRYTESEPNSGNALRAIKLASQLAALGFDITEFNQGTIYNFSAAGMLDEDEKLNAGEKYAEFFTGINRIFDNTKDEDKGFGGVSGGSIPRLSPDDFKAVSSDLEYFIGRLSGLPGVITGLIKYFVKTDISEIRRNAGYEGMDEVYDYLAIEKADRSPHEIVRRFADGRLIVDKKTGELKPAVGYDPMQKIIRALKKNADPSFEQAGLLNFIDYEKLNFSPAGYIGNMLAVNGVLKVKGGFISVSAVTDRQRTGLKCADTEFVSFDGTRRALSCAELLSKLQEEGYNVSGETEISLYEKEMIIKELKKTAVMLKNSREIAGFGVSSGPGGYVSGRIVYKKENIRQDGIWIANFMTPDDIGDIDKARGIITTGGGRLSHANITAREKKKPAVVIKEKWRNNKIEARFYGASRDVKKKDGEALYETLGLKENIMFLEEGSRVLINGETGSVLVFNDIDGAVVDELQNAVDARDARKIRSLLEAHAGDQNISAMIEFIYFQSLGKKELEPVIKTLFDIDAGGFLQEKISELNGAYAAEILERANSVLANIKETGNAGTALKLIAEAEKELRRISGPDTLGIAGAVKKELSALKKQKQKTYFRFVREFSLRVKKLAGKKELSRKELNESAKLIDIAAVWRNFENPAIEANINELRRKTDAYAARGLSGENAGEIMERGVKSLREIGFYEINSFGSKAAHLAKLHSFTEDNAFADAGIGVPDGFAVGTDVFEKAFFEDSNIAQIYQKTKNEFHSAVLEGNEELANKKAEIINKLIDSYDNPALKDKVESMAGKDKLQAVRSSAVGEDNVFFAAAGIGESFLEVPYDQIYYRVKDVWKSFFGVRSIKYMIASGQILNPAVLSQDMAENVQKAGVVFSKDGAGDCAIEAVWGIGEGLVSGKIEPDHVCVHPGVKGAVIYKKASGNIKKIAADAEKGGVRTERLADAEFNKRVLGKKEIEKLDELQRKLEEDAGYPVDVEFAIGKDGRIYILQRRAVTTFNNSFAAAEPGQSVTFTLKDVSGMKDHFAVVAHPVFDETPVPVYRGGIKKGVSEFYIDVKYAAYAEAILEAFAEKLNNDGVLRERFNAPLAAAQRAAEGEIGILPVNYFDPLENEIRGGGPVSVKTNRDLLAAA